MAGLALGWAWFALCSIAFGGRVMRFGEPAAVAEAVAHTLPVDTGPPEAPPSSDGSPDAQRAGQAPHLPRP
jgi:hypothetical protein